MATLSESLKIEVKSSFQSEHGIDGYREASKKISTRSELPLLGIDLEVNREHGEYHCYAWLDSKKSIPLYQAELKTLAKSINRQNSALKKQKSRRQHYLQLTQLLTDIAQYNNYRTVAQLLGVNKMAEIDTDAAAVRSALLTLESAAPTLDIAAKILSRNLPEAAYFIHPFLPQGSNQVTKLSRQLRDNLRGQLPSDEKHQQASNFIKGSYEILNDGISVTLSAVDRNGAMLASRIVKLAPSAYRGVDHKPSSLNFDQLLKNGYLVSNDYRAELNTNQGNEDLLFIEGQTIELFARLNNPGYFYIASHNVSNNLSYLVELSESEGDHKFLRYVNADEVNRWLSLGEFEATEPFGTENLQLIASNQKLINQLPKTTYDNALELYVIQSRNSEQAVIKTRGLKPKRNKKRQIKSAEATLSYSVVKK